MSIRRRVLLSSPRDEWLDARRKGLKHGLVDAIRQSGCEPQLFDVPGEGDLAAGKVWTFDNVDQVMRRCVGAALLGLARWAFEREQTSVLLPTEYCHYEGSLAYAYGLPILALAEEGIERRGIFIPYGLQVLSIPPQADRGWLEGSDFRGCLTNWKTALDQRRDVFLGYSSGSTGTATNLKRYLRELQVSVLDWQEDFLPAGSILERIQEAAARCSAGIFLFTRDDVIESAVEKAAPRDNVVFEAGFFAHAKGKQRVLIVREEGTKMPADLGGDIYALLRDKSDIGPVEPVLKRFVEHSL